MSTSPPDPAREASAPRFDDRTRDIRLPSLPDRPPAVVRPEWQAQVQQAAADTSTAPPVTAAEQQEPLGEKSPPATVSVDVPSEPPPPRPYVLPNEPTDELASPPRVRQQTLAFDSPAGGAPGAPHSSGNPARSQASSAFGDAPSAPPSVGAPGYGPPSYRPLGAGAPSPGPAGRGAAPERTRRWPWVVLTILPILVIVGAGLLLLFLLRGA